MQYLDDHIKLVSRANLELVSRANLDLEQVIPLVEQAYGTQAGILLLTKGPPIRPWASRAGRRRVLSTKSKRSRITHEVVAATTGALHQYPPHV